jgi:hypothetical protein
MFDQENNLAHHLLCPPLPVNNHLGASSGMSLRSQSSQARGSARPTSAMLLGASDLRALLRPATSLRGTTRGSMHHVITRYAYFSFVRAFYYAVLLGIRGRHVHRGTTLRQ